MPKEPVHSSASHLRQAYETQRGLFEAQAALVQRYLEATAHQLAEALLQHSPQVRFVLPDRVTTNGHTLAVPPAQREQTVGRLADRITHPDTILTLRQFLTELEQAPEPAVAVSAGIIRYATARHLVSNMLPAGRSVTYLAADGEETPTLPDGADAEIGSAITAATDAIAEEGAADGKRGELHVPYVPYARRFYLPQWVAFDATDRLLVNSITEAEAHLASMQNFVSILHAAVGLAAYFVADEDYQQKRYGMLGQLINQGRALARFQTARIIQTIQRRAAAGSLNRGLSLSLPYFDDQTLQVKIYPIEIIPAGRIMFVPAFVVRAAREEGAKVAQDTRINISTRRHLLTELLMLEKAFESKT